MIRFLALTALLAACSNGISTPLPDESEAIATADIAATLMTYSERVGTVSEECRRYAHSMRVSYVDDILEFCDVPDGSMACYLEGLDRVIVANEHREDPVIMPHELAHAIIWCEGAGGSDGTHTDARVWAFNGVAAGFDTVIGEAICKLGAEEPECDMLFAQ